MLLRVEKLINDPVDDVSNPWAIEYEAGRSQATITLRQPFMEWPVDYWVDPAESVIVHEEKLGLMLTNFAARLWG